MDGGMDGWRDGGKEGWKRRSSCSCSSCAGVSSAPGHDAEIPRLSGTPHGSWVFLTKFLVVGGPPGGSSWGFLPDPPSCPGAAKVGGVEVRSGGGREKRLNSQKCGRAAVVGGKDRHGNGSPCQASSCCLFLWISSSDSSRSESGKTNADAGVYWVYWFQSSSAHREQSERLWFAPPRLPRA